MHRNVHVRFGGGQRLTRSGRTCPTQRRSPERDVMPKQKPRTGAFALTGGQTLNMQEQRKAEITQALLPPPQTFMVIDSDTPPASPKSVGIPSNPPTR
ncbi:hypothetical protein Dd703_0721 [Musicola paradisiaca Ech703]|uniref:Uncharacterized protein n=1 Tax=Musicola paradisiaca (strain Ech703) TaxID=579405 RepID=C6CA57_MUSP7|nr:hypothetical protein Dd703_0721 [Musicola paradisiaca Ech703]